MKIGTPKEIKNNESRVGLNTASVRALVEQGHDLFIEKGAGLGSGYSDEAYKTAGATILNTAAEIYQAVEMIVKVKEPLAAEYDLIQEGQIVFTYFHFASPLLNSFRNSACSFALLSFCSPPFPPPKDANEEEDAPKSFSSSPAAKIGDDEDAIPKHASSIRSSNARKRKELFLFDTASSLSLILVVVAKSGVES